MIELFRKEVVQTEEIKYEHGIGYYCLLIALAMLVGGLAQETFLLILSPMIREDMIVLLRLYSTIVSSFVLLFIALKIEKRSLFSLGITKEHFLCHYLLGLGLGFLTLSGAFLITYLFEGTNYLGLADMNPVLLLLFFVGFLFQGFEEELLCRGFMMFGMSKKYSLMVSILFNAFFFASLHFGNPGVNVLSLMNIFLAGVSFSCMAVYFEDLWVASGAHTMWNFAQGNIYGILVSGMNMGPSIFQFELVGNSIVSGGRFGLEGGMGVFFIEIITILFFCITYKKKMR